MASSLKTYQQGQFDSMCGLYTLVNTANHLRGPLPEPELQQLFNELIEEFSRHWKVEKVVIKGTSGFQISRLIQLVLAKRYRLVSKKPFHKDPKTRMNIVWDKVKRWIDEGGVVITSDEYHWSLIVKMTNKKAYLIDSAGLEYIHKKEAFGRGEPVICASLLYFIKRAEDI